MALGTNIQDFGEVLLHLSLEAAPWLVLGLVAAGLVKVLIKMEWMSRWLGKPGLGSVSRAAVVGTPLPLCSCGVLPAAIGLRRQGASRGATVSFLVSTPANGVDSLAVSYALLGPFLTIARLLSALVSSLLAGLLAEWSPRRDEAVDSKVPAEVSESCCESGPIENAATEKSCCDSNPIETATEMESSCCGVEAVTESAEGCCDSTATSESEVDSAKGPKWIQGFRFAFSDIFDDIKFWLVIGLVAATVVQVVVPQSFIATYGQGWIGLFVMLVIGLPMYICATASVPVAAALLLSGVSPGAIVVFLLAGPATNIGTIMAIRKELGGGPLAGYLLGVCGGALVSGWVTNLLAARWELQLAEQVEHVQAMVPQGVAWVTLVILILAAVTPLRRRLIGS